MGRNPDDECHFNPCPATRAPDEKPTKQPTSDRPTARPNAIKTTNAAHDKGTIAQGIEDSQGLPVCTREIILCYDGHYVGRDPSNNCEFYPCATSDPTSQPVNSVSLAGGSTEMQSHQVNTNTNTAQLEGTHHEFNFKPIDDASIRQSRSSSNYGFDDDLKVDVDSGTYHSLIKFDISYLTSGQSGTIQAATLRLYSTDSAATSGGSVEGTDGLEWNESTVSWSNAPQGNGHITDSLGRISAGQWCGLDVTPLVRIALDDKKQVITFRLSTLDHNRGAYASKEFMDGEFSPRLIVDMIIGKYAVPEDNQVQPQLQSYHKKGNA